MLELHRNQTLSAQKGAVALGFFDGVHQGHRAVLHAASDCARTQGLLACAFTFAAQSVPTKRDVALEYLYTDAQKMALFAACGIQAAYCSDFAALCALDGETFCRQILVEMFRAREVFCGSDFRFGVGVAWDFAALRGFGEQMGFGVHEVAPVRFDGTIISSTAIRAAMKHGNPELAQSLLGAPYQISGSVGHGAALGRTRAVPTINLSFAKGQLVPRYGVYVSCTHTPQGILNSLTNVGVKPTVSDAEQVVAETFLLDFSGDLYGAACRVELLHFLRDERRFQNLDALYQQIAQDQADCRAWLAEHADGWK